MTLNPAKAESPTNVPVNVIEEVTSRLRFVKRIDLARKCTLIILQQQWRTTRGGVLSYEWRDVPQVEEEQPRRGNVEKAAFPAAP